MPSKPNNGMKDGLLLRGDRWRFKANVNGKQRWVTVPRDKALGKDQRAEALLFKADFFVEKPEDRTVGSNSTIEEYAAEWIANQVLSPKTRDMYERAFKGHLSPLTTLKLNELKVQHLKSIITKMRGKGLEENTIRITFVPLRAMIAEAVILDDYRGVNPFDKLPKGSRPKPGKQKKRVMPKPELIQNLIEVADEKAIGGGGPRFGALIALGAMAGLRLSEALGLRWKDVDFAGKKLHISHQLGYKGDELVPVKTDGSVRKVELCETLAEILRELRGPRVDPTAFVLETENGTPVSQRNAQRAFTVARKRVGEQLDGLTFHGLRHVFASLLIAKRCDVGYVSDQLGHDDPNVTLRVYRHEFLAVRVEGEAAAAIDGAFLRRAQ